MTGRDLISFSDSTLGFGASPRSPRGTFPWYSQPVTVRKVDENSTAISVNNTTSETLIASVDLPALVLSSTGAARLSVVGTILGEAGNPVTIRLSVSDASSTAIVLATSGVQVADSTNLHAWSMETWMLGKQPGVNRIWGVFDVAQAGASATLKPSTFSAVGFSTMGFDETDELTVNITAQMAFASTAATVTRQVAILEAIN